jgi:Macrocin-O-methyltransferase (TylF)
MNHSFQSDTSKFSSVEEKYIDLLMRSLLHWPWLTTEERRLRMDGRDWPRPGKGDTMIGVHRLRNLRDCVVRVLSESIPGDLVETGVWRGGASILMAGILSAQVNRQSNVDRKVWLFDSFEGIPAPDSVSFPHDAGAEWHLYPELAVPLDVVRDLFASYGLLSEQVQFVKGYFRDSLQEFKGDSIAVLRLDGDLYESTWQVLDALYDRVQIGGFVIVDDYHALETCKAAVDDFIEARGISATLQKIDWGGAFWRVS